MSNSPNADQRRPVTNQRGDVVTHPAIAIERFAMQNFISAMRLLRLDINAD